MRVACPRRVWSAHALFFLAGIALLAGCHKSTVAPPGTPVVTMANLTNSKDFASYIVTIDSITLTSNTGTLAYPLVTPTIVDLVRLNDLAELVEAPAVPSGTYVSATLALDFSAASVWVNVNGQPQLASVLAPGGLGLTVEHHDVGASGVEQPEQGGLGGDLNDLRIWHVHGGAAADGEP